MNRKTKDKLYLILILTILIILVSFTHNKTINKSKDFNLNIIEKNIKDNPEKQMKFYKKVRKRDIEGIEEVINY